MTTARRHHYIPQCYLKAFAVPRKKAFQTTVFDARSRKTFPANIKNVAVELDFNRIEVDGHEPDAFEKGLAQFEGELAPALERTIAASSLKDVQDRAIILNFMCLLALRNPRFRETFRGFYERLAKMTMEIALATPERWDRQMHKMREAGYIGNTNVTYQDLKRFVEEDEYTVHLPSTGHIKYELGAFDSLLETFFARRWVVLHAPAETGWLITCDHPVRLAWSEPESRRFPPGHGLRGTEVLFPLSPKLALAGAFEFEEGQELTLSAYSVASVNSAIVANAEWQVYARDAHFSFLGGLDGTPRKASRLLDDSLFKRPYGDDEED